VDACRRRVRRSVEGTGCGRPISSLEVELEIEDSSVVSSRTGLRAAARGKRCDGALRVTTGPDAGPDAFCRWPLKDLPNGEAPLVPFLRGVVFVPDAVIRVTDMRGVGSREVDALGVEGLGSPFSLVRFLGGRPTRFGGVATAALTSTSLSVPSSTSDESLFSRLTALRRDGALV
jgi:hypothetical protein